MSEATYYHALLDRSLAVTILAGPDKRNRYRVRMPAEAPFNGAVRLIPAVWVSKT